MAYEELSDDILRLVGGPDNVTSLAHCVSRLRFTLKDEAIAETEAIEALSGVMAVRKTSGQYQVIVGDKVVTMFKYLEPKLNLGAAKGEVPADDDDAPKPKRTIGAIVLDFLSAVMLPTIPVMCAGGLIKALNVVLNMAGVLAIDSGMYTLLAAMGDAVFYFIPVLFGYNAFKKLGGTPFLGLLLGAMLCYPTINGVDIDLFGYVVNATYTSTVLPIILISILGANLEKLLNKYLPEMLKNFFGPMLVVLITFPIGFALIGPASNILSFMLSAAFNAVYGFSPVLCGLILGGLYQLLVLMGLHFVIMMMPILDVVQGIPSPIPPLVWGCNLAVAGTCLVAWMRQKDAVRQADSFSAFIQAGIFGITEPAVYGVLVPNVRLFVTTCIAGAVCGAVAGFIGLNMYTMGGMGLLLATIPTYLNPADPQLFPTVIPFLLGFPISLILGLAVYREDGAGLGFKTRHMKKREAKAAAKADGSK